MLKLFRKKSSDAGRELQKILGGHELPSFPQVVMNVLGLHRDPESSSADIAAHLEMDPGMHVKVLKTVNSASFGLSTEVNSLLHATNLLGRGRLESIVVAIAVKAVMPKLDTSAFDLAAFWRSSAARASLARVVASSIHPATQAESFTAALLQDMAVPILVASRKSEYCDVYNRWTSGEYDRLDVVERMAFGFDHASVGALAAEEWGLPDYLVAAIRSHHEQNDDEAFPAVRLVANIRDGAVEEAVDVILRAGLDRYGLTPDTLAQELAQALEDAKDFYRMLS
jgi:HD-like signal output (HDOD) protein